MLKATFHTTVVKLADLPADSTAEVAFVGRSNAGKSSAINVLANQKRLAFVSKTPGRTQQLNFFLVREGLFLVDLPGYGYARAPLEQQRAWQALVGDYLVTRNALRGLILIMDARHPLTGLDEQMIQWWQGAGKPIHVLLSKADKLSRSQAISALRVVRTYLAERRIPGEVQLFSALRRMGIDEAEAVLRTWLGLPEMAASKPVSGGTETKKTRLKGTEPGSNGLNIGVKAPAQGGKSGR